MKQLERVTLVEARRYTRSIISWLRASFTVTTSLQHDDLFEVILWRTTMTLADSMETNQDFFKPIIPECTPDAVACVMYDSLIHGKFCSLWEQRSAYIAETFDWDLGPIDIKAKERASLPTSEEYGMTQHDVDYEGALPSLNDGMDMRKWLQKESKKESKKRVLEEGSSQHAGKQSVLSFNICLNQHQG